MNVTERREEVRRLLVSNGEVFYSDLVERFGISEMTARRDIEVLEADGAARRIKHGAIGTAIGAWSPRLTAARTFHTRPS